MKPTERHKKTSKFLSYVLRHKPDAIGLELDLNGWADIDELIAKAKAFAEASDLDRALLQETIDTSDKKRFVISEDGRCVRANQGHSIPVDLQLAPAIPPDVLYHGTATRFLDSILREGLTPRDRQQVHLSQDKATANAVGQRYGKPVILTVKARLMHEQGLVFYLSENGVWLTDSVPAAYIAPP